MRKFNKLKHTPDIVTPIYETMPLYQSQDGETLDADEALKTPLGQPIQVGYSKSFKPRKRVGNTLSFNPLDPDSRNFAIMSRASVNNSFVNSTTYLDKLELADKSNKICQAFENNFNSTDFNIDNNG